MSHNLKDMIGGWFIGDFDPSVWKTSAFEVAVKEYKSGDTITVVVKRPSVAEDKYIL